MRDLGMHGGSSGWCLRRFHPAAACVLALVALTGVYLALGFFRLVLRNGWPFACDLSLRWHEHRSLWAGINPGTLESTANYPPWSYGIGLFLAPPWQDWQAVRIWFAILNVLALTGVGVWGWRRATACGDRRGESGKERTDWRGGLLATMLLSPIGYLYTLSSGQYSILVAGFCLLALISLQRRWDAISGVFMALAFLKPHIALFFLLPLVLTRRWKALLGFAMTLGLFSTIPWILTGVDPIRWLLQTRANAPQFVYQSGGPVGLLHSFDLPPLLALGIPFVVGGLLCAVLVWYFRHRPLLDLFALCAIAGLLSSYHKAYDYPVLLFLIAALFTRARRDIRATTPTPSPSDIRHSPPLHHSSLPGAGFHTPHSAMALVLLQLSLVFPLRIRHHAMWPVTLAELLIWALALVALLQPRRSE